MKCEKCNQEKENVNFIHIAFSNKPHLMGHFCEECKKEVLGKDYKILQKILDKWEKDN